MLTFGRRLDFEGEALAQIYSPAIARPRRRAKSRMLGSTLVIIAVLTVAVLGGGMLVQNGLFGVDRRGITKTAEALLGGIAAEDHGLELSVCAEGPEGARKLAKLQSKAFDSEAGIDDLDFSQEDRLRALEQLRTELGSAGVDWTDVRLLAFGGIRGHVIDSKDMRKPVTSLTGSVYFASGDRIYAVEFTAWRCDGDYVVTDVWQGSEVSVGYEDLETLSAAQFDAFERELPEPDSPVRIEYPKQLFFYF